MRAFLGWLRREEGHCRMVAIPTAEQEDARRVTRCQGLQDFATRERKGLVHEQTKLINRLKAMFASLGTRDFNPHQRLPLTFELASLATTLGVRHGLVILDAQQYHSGGCLVGGTSVKGGIVFERVLICYGPVGNISASSGLFILLDMAR